VVHVHQRAPFVAFAAMIVCTISRSPVTTIVVAACVMFASAGCGARWNDEQRAAVLSRQQGRSVSATGTGDASDGASGEVVDGGAASGSEGAAGGSGASSPSGAAAASGTKAAASAGKSLPCAAPSKEKGVSDTQIT